MHYTRMIVLALLSLLPVTLSFAGEKLKGKPTLRIYSVDDLTYPIRDYPAPKSEGSELPVEDEGEINIFRAVEQPHREAITVQSVAQVIQNRIRPESWDPNLGTSIEERAGQLIVMQRPDVHASIVKLLGLLRKALKCQVVAKAMWVAAEKQPNHALGEDQTTAKLLGSLGGTALANLNVVCFHTQRVHVMSGRERAYITDFDVSGDTYDPVIKRAFEGYIFDVRPTVSAERTNIELDIRFAANGKATHIKRRLQNQVVPDPKEKRPASEKRTSARSAGLEINTPEQGGQYIKTSLTIPASRWVLASASRNPDRSAAKPYLLLFVRADLLTGK